MKLRVKHTTKYHYDTEVFLEPQHLYFYPCYRPYISREEFTMQVTPKPSGLAERVDAEGNIYYQCWFNDHIDHMVITVELEVTTSNFNPFDFIVESNPKNDHVKSLAPFCEGEALTAAIKAWSDGIKEACGDNPVTFLTMLAREIHNDWKHAPNYESTLLSPEEAFKRKWGSCRDLAWMYIQTVRHYHIPARFVSGYSHNPELTGHELHAWAEVWLNGAGWIGIDPSSGLLTTQTYIPVATSYHPSNTLPVQGTYRGTAQSSLDTTVEITKIA